jgi:hypothetical protein
MNLLIGFRLFQKAWDAVHCIGRYIVGVEILALGFVAPLHPMAFSDGICG